MHISFEASQLTPAEAQGLIALLSTLSASGTLSTQPWNLAPGIPQTNTVSGLSGGANQVIGSAFAPSTTEATQSTQLGPVEVPPATTPTTDSTPDTPSTKRARRTKEQIAQDEAKNQSASTLASVGTTTATVAGLTEAQVEAALNSQPASEIPTTSKPLSADDFRALLNDHIQRRSMEDAIAVLQSFGANRVSEALALPTDKLNELTKALRA